MCELHSVFCVYVNNLMCLNYIFCPDPMHYKSYSKVAKQYVNLLSDQFPCYFNPTVFTYTLNLVFMELTILNKYQISAVAVLVKIKPTSGLTYLLFKCILFNIKYKSFKYSGSG